MNGSMEEKGIRNAISAISKHCKHLTVTGSPEVPWFPTRIEDFEYVGKSVLSEGFGIEITDHPGFSD